MDPGNGETDQSGEILVLPEEPKSFGWSRAIGSRALRTDEDVARPELWLMNIRLWVRDLGLNAHDVALFNADLRFFSRDGSHLIVKPAPPFTLMESGATPLPDRVYDRLDASKGPTT